MNNEKTEAKAISRADRVQRTARQGEGIEHEEKERIKEGYRKKIRSIREGHITGGYCETEILQQAEKSLASILNTELEEIERSGQPGQAQRIFAIERELRGFSWKPRLVVAQD
jgi:hypothetical protein